jgi:hypothetical protein
MTQVTSLSVSLNVIVPVWLIWLQTVEPFVHTSLDLYAFIALAPSSSTVEQLINIVKSDNEQRLQRMNPVTKVVPPRHLNVCMLLWSLWMRLLIQISFEIVWGSRLQQSWIWTSCSTSRAFPPSWRRPPNLWQKFKNSQILCLITWSKASRVNRAS